MQIAFLMALLLEFLKSALSRDCLSMPKSLNTCVCRYDPACAASRAAVPLTLNEQ